MDLTNEFKDSTKLYYVWFDGDLQKYRHGTMHEFKWGISASFRPGDHRLVYGPAIIKSECINIAKSMNEAKDNINLPSYILLLNKLKKHFT